MQMTFEEQLRVALDALADRLRGHVGREVETALASLADAAQTDRQAAVADAESRGREAGIADGVAQGRQEAEAAAQAAAAAAQTAEAAPAGDIAAGERLVHALRSIDAARSLTEILDTLIHAASHEAARVAVVLLAGDRVRVWRTSGFDAAGDGQDPSMTLDGAGVIADAARTNEAVLDELIGAPPFAVPPPRRHSFAAPIALAGQVVAVLYADQGPGAHTGDHASDWAAPVEILTRHAARCLEVVTAFKAARAMAPSANGRGAAAPDASADEEAAARRYARLLVSEIKLYHEPDVATGRRERDLGTRLGGEIARARVMYEERVALHVRERADYFQDELVRTLAGGDGTLLDVEA